MSNVLLNYQMKNAPIAQTHFNGETPYYVSEYDDNVQFINNLLSENITTTNIKVTGNVDMSGAVMTSDLNMNGNSIINSNLLPSQTAYAVTRTVQVAPTTFSGSAMNLIGSTFTVPKTGMYILNEIVSFNTSATVGVTIGASDSMGVGIETVPAGGPGAGRQLKPWTVPAGEGNDYAVTASEVTLLTAGVTYQTYYQVSVFAGGGISIPTTSFTLYITALC